MIAPSIDGRAQLIEPGAWRDVPVRSTTSRSPRLISRTQIGYISLLFPS
jgi:hypothetical protein